MVASQSDAVVLTVSSGVTQALVRRSFDRLRDVSANIMGMVLNRARSSEAEDFALRSGSVRSRSSRRLPAPGQAGGATSFGSVGAAMESSSTEGRK